MTIAVQTAQNGDTETATAVTQISGTVAAGLSGTSPVAGYLVTLTIQTWTVFVQSLVGMTRDLFEGSPRKSEGHRADDGRRPPGRPVPRRPHCLRLTVAVSASDLLDLTRD